MCDSIPYLKIVKGAEIYAPEFLGQKDLILAGDKIAFIGENISLGKTVEEINAEGKYLVPGFIDNHVHITGGGGEGSYKTRTPEIVLSDIIGAGVTTVVGCLGTDGVTRTMSNLLAKARALEEEGITAYIYTGSYRIPVDTLTGSIRQDLIFIKEIIGVGEVALSDHRSSQPTLEEFTKVAAEAHVGGMLSGKAGIVVIHLGNAAGKLSLLEELIEKTEIPKTQFLPTHVGRDGDLMTAAITYAKNGGLVDLTSSTPKHFPGGKKGTIDEALKYMFHQGVPVENISLSSDGQGSLPEFDADGRLTGLGVGKVSSLYEAFKAAVLKQKIPLTSALQVVTSNPARNLKLKQKGEIAVGRDADLLLLNRDDLSIDSVIARGRFMVKDGIIRVKGTFE